MIFRAEVIDIPSIGRDIIRFLARHGGRPERLVDALSPI